MHPTETDSLLPKHDAVPRQQGINDSSSRRHSKLIACWCLLFAAVVIGLNRNPLDNFGMYNPKTQLNQLNTLTQSSIDKLLGIHMPLLGRVRNDHSRDRHGKMNIITGKDVNPKVYHCTSTLMIMRHCDKGVKVKTHGITRTIDPKDKNGDRHCNAKGVARSKYIASLFVEPEKYERLISNLGRSQHASIPPVPMVSSTLRKNDKVGYTPAKKKPQFPTPQKLYALNDSRHRHSNFREIETITPLADKFALSVDERFGVYEEGLLAKDYFERLSQSVMSSVDIMRRYVGVACI